MTLFVVGLLLPGWWRLLALALPLVYAAGLIGAAAKVAVASGVRTALRFPVCAAIMHLAYAAGFVWGVIGLIRRGDSRRMGLITRGRQPDPALDQSFHSPGS